VLGANLFYDGRHTDSHFFHQIGVGGEALFDRWEFRINGYIIVGPAHKLIAESETAILVGNLLIVDRLRTREVAMGGLDAEVGALLPILPQFSPRVFAGYYHYSAEGMPSVNGLRARFEAWLTQNVSLHAAIQNDTVFDTTASGGFAIHFGGARVRRDGGPRSAEERLGQRVVRDVDIVIAQQMEHERTVFVSDIVHPPNDGGGGGSKGSNTPPSSDPGKTPSPPPDPGTKPCPPPKPPCGCLRFPGKPGDPATFPGKHFPPGFHHDCFPGKGRYKYICDDDDCCRLLPRIDECGKHHGDYHLHYDYHVRYDSHDDSHVRYDYHVRYDSRAHDKHHDHHD
jgi:Inverse autotransporter, beta-domain